MIIEVNEALAIENIGTVTENIEAGIDTISMPFLFEMLSGSLYSNPIGSICREITSNCFDSHIEAGVDDAVVVKKGCDEEGYYISFIDVGVGLSPERMKNIYMNYFSSTKRETNTLIGGFGLGSKSMLSYTDYFYINTTFNGVHYQYIFSKGKTVPTLDLMDKSNTTVRNGTEVRMYIKEGDTYTFKEELTNQLCYFDNVYFEGWGIDNDYTIFEGENFKYRTKNSYNTKMHIVLDKVAYPIDWKRIGLSEYNIAVGVKFKIGELLVTPNREQLRYTDEIITLVRERIKLAIEELTSIFDKQNKASESFFDWYAKKGEKPFISFTKDDGEVNKLYLYGLEDIRKKNAYKYFEGIEDLADNSDILELFYHHVGEIKNGKKKKHSYIGNMSSEVYKQPNRIFISDSPYTNTQKDWRVKNGYILYPKVPSLKKYYFTKNVDPTKNSRIFNDTYFNLGSGLKIYKLMKAIREEVSNRCNEYRALTSNELLEYKEENRSNNSSLQKKLEGNIFVNDLNRRDGYDWSIKAVDRYTGIIVYGFKADKRELERANELLRQVKNKWFSDYPFNTSHKVFRILQIAKQNEKYFKNKRNMVHVSKLYGDNPIFRDMASSFKVEYFFTDIQEYSDQGTLGYIEHIKLICTDIGDVLDELYKFYLSTRDNSASSERRCLREDVIRIANEHNLYNPKIELLFNKVNDWYKDIEIIRYTNINDKTLPFILKFLREKKKRLNVEYYQRILNTDNTTQLELKFKDPEEDEIITKFESITNNILI